MGKRYFGHYGVVIVSLAGGLVSSASTTAAAAILAAIAAPIASALSNLPVIYRVAKNAGMTRGLALKTGAVVLVGVVALVVEYRLGIL